MDGIAAIEARVAEICARFAPPAPPPAASGSTFATHLRNALGPGDVDAWIDEAITRTGVPDSWAPGLKTIAQHESSLNPAAANPSGPLGLMQMLSTTGVTENPRPEFASLRPVQIRLIPVDRGK